MKRAAFIIPGRDLGAAVELTRHAAALGYHSVWVTHGLGRDSFLVLAAYGAATQRIGLGNGVVPIYPRHPVAMAQAALTLAQTTGGRFTLGVGVSHKPMIEGMLPPGLATALGAVGDAAAGRAYVQAYRDAGVTLPAIRPITFPDAPWYRATLEQAAGW